MTDYLQFDSSGTNEKKTDYIYNDIGQLTEIQYLSGATVKEKYTYAYDARGMIDTETLYTNYGTANTTTKDHDYDSIGRLIETVQGSVTTSWTYDKVGNRETQSDGTDVTDYIYNEFNQLEEIDIISSGTTYEYLDFTYDDRGAQLTQVETLSGGGTETTSYSYDAAGRLAKTSDGTDVTNNVFNGAGQRVQQILNQGLANEDVTKYYYTGSAILFTTDAANDKLTENILTPGGSIIASQDAWASSKLRRVYDQPEVYWKLC